MRVLKRIWSYQEFVPTFEPIYEYHNSLVLLDYYRRGLFTGFV